LAACTPQAAANPDAADLAFFGDILAEAQAGGADAAQLEVLSAAAQGGSIELGSMAPLFSEFFDCISRAGGRGEFYGTLDLASGVSVPSYRVQVPHSAANDDALAEAFNVALLDCEAKSIAFVWKAIQLQPTTIELKNADIEAHSDEIRECLANLGIDLDDNATADELGVAVVEATAETGTRCYDV